MASKVKRLRYYSDLKKMRGQLYLCKVIEWEIHFPILRMWMTSYFLVVMSIYYRKRKEILVLEVQKNVLGRIFLVKDRDLPRNKKRGIRNVA